MSLFKRQIEDTTSADYAEQSSDAYRDYDCYEENRCSWWWGQVSLPSNPIQPILPERN